MKPRLRILRESTFQPFQAPKPTPQYPPDHNPVLPVPKGGSSCSNCKYVGKDMKTCKNKYYIEFMGTSKLPYPADKMCSDWWSHG